MKVEDITNEEDVSRYIEGCLNDLEFGLCTKYDTERYLHSLIIYLIKLERGKRDKELADILKLGKQRSDQQEEHIQRLLKALVLIRDFDEDGDFDDPGQVAEYYLSQFT